MSKGFQDAFGNLDESSFNVPKVPGIETTANVSSEFHGIEVLLGSSLEELGKT
jgi:hypothetical protein